MDIVEEHDSRKDIAPYHLISEMSILKPDRGFHPQINYRCPKCNGKNVTLEEFNSHYRFYRCDDCGYIVE